MFERYTEKARRVIFYARFEASEFGTPAIETEHLLLALLREDKVHLDLYLPSVASAESIRAQMQARSPERKKIPTSVHLPLTDECKRVLVYAAEEADGLHHSHIGPEHLFLRLLREENCFPAQMLRERGAELKPIRKALAALPTMPTPIIVEMTADEALRRLYGDAAGTQAAENASSAKTGSSGMIGFERYTQEARRGIFMARNSATQFGSPYIESEHLLLGMMLFGQTPPGDRQLLLFFPSPVPFEVVHKRVEEHTVVREVVPGSAPLPLSNECKRALAYGAEEAERLGNAQIDVAHVLLGLLREEGCFAASILREHGADPDRIRMALAALANPPHET